MPDQDMTYFLHEIDPAAPGIDIESEYDTMTIKYKLKGPTAQIPATATEFFKVIGETDYLEIMAEIVGLDSSDLDDVKNRLLLMDRDELLKKTSERFEIAAPGKVAWATFFNDGFAKFVPGRTSARIIINDLGLGHYKDEAGCVSFEYDINGHAEPIAPYVPTVGDAGFYEYFRPTLEPDPDYGTTYPLDGVTSKGRPEIVHKNRKADIVKNIEFF